MMPYVKWKTLIEGENVLNMNATAAIKDPAMPVFLQPNLFTNAPATGPKTSKDDKFYGSFW